MSLDYHKHVALVAETDVRDVLPRDVKYKGSWQKRGGVGMFDNLARKWDRIEAAAEAEGYDIHKAFENDPGPTGLIDDIRDLRRYLLLVEAWLWHHEPTLMANTVPNRPPGSETARQDRPTDSQPALPLVQPHEAEKYMQAKLLEYMRLSPGISAPQAYNYMMQVGSLRLVSSWQPGAVRDLVQAEFIKAGKLVREPMGSDDPHDQAPDPKEKRSSPRRRAAPQEMTRPKTADRRWNKNTGYSYGRRSSD